MKYAPIFFEKNRVARVYTGGKLFSSFLGDDSEDGFFPEEWVASAVKALNRVPRGAKEGISKPIDGELYFDELLASDKFGMLGSSGKMRILVKYLDSAIRLPAQAHPDKAFSRKHFNSEYGKTESWVILDKRPGARIYFGFKDGVDRETFAAAIDAGETDRDAMERLMEYREPEIGDVFLVPARTVHAIGAGCLLLEVQEPTDFTIQPERMCGEYRLSDYQMYLGLSREIALDCFDFESYGDAAIVKGKKTPVILKESVDACLESLISYEDTPCFAVKRLTVSGKDVAGEDDTAIYVVTDGDGEIRWNGQRAPLRKGDYFFIPHALKGQFSFSANSKLQLVICLPSKN